MHLVKVVLTKSKAPVFVDAKDAYVVNLISFVLWIYVNFHYETFGILVWFYVDVRKQDLKCYHNHFAALYLRKT